ncbi:glycosyltransferase [bacterium]|nr:glycosyltransferase [bacterium]
MMTAPVAGLRRVSETRPKIRLAVVDSHPIQYHYQYFRLLAANPNIDLTVFFCWDTRDGVLDPSYGKVEWDVPVLEGDRYRFVRNRSFRPGPGDRFLAQVNPGLISLLTPEHFDAVWVWGYSTLSAWLAVATARARGMRVLFRGEATLDVRRSWWRRMVKETVVRGFLKMVDGVAYSCAANRRYYAHYGVPEKALIFSPCAVDNRFFQNYSRGGDKWRCKEELGLAADRPVLLFVGRFVELKQPLDMIQAVESMRETIRPILLLVGDGPLRTSLEDYCRTRNLDEIRFLGFRNQSELPLYYCAADVTEDVERGNEFRSVGRGF